MVLHHVRSRLLSEAADLRTLARRARCSRPIMAILIRRHRLVGLALWS